MKTIRLMYVAVDDGKTSQSNKFYNMKENGDGTFTAEYGRVGCDRPQYKTYSTSKWQATYNSKVKKGYRDVTELLVESSGSQVSVEGSSDVKSFMRDIQRHSSQSVKANYNVSFESVTQAMVDEAQSIINKISPEVRIGGSSAVLNRHLMELFHVIPRKMKDVHAHLFPSSLSTDVGLKQAQKILMSEQDTLDSMAGQVSAHVAVGDKTNLLESLGLTVELVEDGKVIDMIRKMMEQKKNHFVRAFHVVNSKTQPLFDRFKEREPNQQLLWHGSRNQNWFSIMQSGLLIRPSGAVHTGSMFGDSLYFASQCRKAMNYTSLSGSYWARGSSNQAFMALYDTKLGKQKHIYKHTRECYSLSWKGINQEGFDSVYAHGGADLINDEFCVYQPNQCTIKYMVELKA